MILDHGCVEWSNHKELAKSDRIMEVVLTCKVGKGTLDYSMHSVQQHCLHISHGIANIQSRSQQADNIVLRQASLLRRLLQSLYRNEDGYPVFGLHDFMPPQIVC